MTINYLMRIGSKINLELNFVDSRLIKVCSHCRVNGYFSVYKMGKQRIRCQIEDNGKLDKGLIEWFLN